MLHEIFEFLVKYEGAARAVPKAANKSSVKEPDSWDEIPVHMFRNMKVFAHRSGTKMLIAIPTHVYGRGDVKYHVISEKLGDASHNGKYEMLTPAEFASKYACNYIEQAYDTTRTAKITDLAEIMVNDLTEIKKLKRKTPRDREESVNHFSKLILKFMTGMIQPGTRG